MKNKIIIKNIEKIIKNKIITMEINSMNKKQ